MLGGGERCYLLFEQQEGEGDFRWPLNTTQAFTKTTALLFV